MQTDYLKTSQFLSKSSPKENLEGDSVLSTCVSGIVTALLSCVLYGESSSVEKITGDINR